MIYRNWMSFIKDEVKLNKLIMPSAHNAGTKGMHRFACCQDHGIKTQLEYGMRHFCIRLNTDKKGNIVVCHGPTNGAPLAETLAEITEFLNENPTEFIILDIREYYDQVIGPFKFKFYAEPKKVDEILAATVCPEKYAYTDFGHVKDISMGDIRKSGKRFLLLNYRKDYKYSVDCPCIIPWEKKVNGNHAYPFTRETLRYFDDYTTDGLYWFQTQQTPNLGVPIGISTPRKLDKLLRPHFSYLTDGIKSNAVYLERANIIAGDFMTADYMKSCEILKLNLDKGNVKDELIEEYKEGLKWN